ncbi:DNA cytosine methyltransferase [Paraburkholderia sp.]|uniref:DNA cytosine methyltransferase n=1 Tax=Paraburkholderia sp. TaxID=1926495 RepID=UPI003C7A9E3D
MNELHLFAGAGGGILAGQLRGNRCVCAVELDPYAQAVLVARQNDGTFSPFPIWDDVRTFDGLRWRGIVDAVCGGFPCQDVSAAGTGDGLDGERSGLWTEMARIIRQIRPKRVEVENSPMLTSRGLGRVLGDLAAMGFDVEWGVLSAADTGAPHLRERIWILANARCGRCGGEKGRQMEQPRRVKVECGGETLANADSESGEQRWPRDTAQGARGWDTNRGGISAHVSDTLRDRLGQRTHEQEHEYGSCGTAHAGHDGSQESLADAVCECEQGFVAGCADPQVRQGSIERSDRPRGYGFGRWPAEPGMGRVVDGMANRAHRIRALGNGQVPRVAAAAFTILRTER